MADFDPVPPPLDLPAVPALLSPRVPLNPPMVGEATPFEHVDAENRDLILESIRTWVWRNLLPWTTSWQDQLTAWEGDAETQLNAWMGLADAYITEHAVSGLSFRTTTTPIAPAGTTTVVLVVDQDLRPIVVGDLVLDEAPDGNYGIVTSIADPTHAVVTYVGSLLGPNGLSFRTTASAIAGAGTSDVVLGIVVGWPPLVGDLVVNQTSGNFGQVTIVIDTTHATVVYVGSLLGPVGPQGNPGVVQSVVAGANVTVNDTDPANPIVSAAVGGGANYYTDPVVMNAAAASFPNGTIGILASEGHNLLTSSWIITDSAWQAASLVLMTNDPSLWVAFLTWLDLGTNTAILISGTVLVTEVINGSHPSWNPNISAFTQDKDVNVFANLGVNCAPADSASFNLANNFTNTSHATVVELVGVALGFETEPGIIFYPDYEIRVWGKFDATGGHIDLGLSDTTLGPDTGLHYASFGTTEQFNAGVISHDPDFAAPLGSSSRWVIANDTTGDPVFIDAVITLRHQMGPNEVGITGHTSSLFYDALEMVVMFNRQGTLYYYDADLSVVRNGLIFYFTQPFTGLITVKQI